MEEKTKYTDGMLIDPRMESKGLGDSQLKEGPLERRLVMIRSDECLRQLGASKAISAASSRKKDGRAIVSQEIDSDKSPYQGDEEHGKARAMGSRCKLRASGGLDAAPRPSAPRPSA